MGMLACGGGLGGADFAGYGQLLRGTTVHHFDG